MLKQFFINKKNYERFVNFCTTDWHSGYFLGMLLPGTWLPDQNTGDPYYPTLTTTQETISKTLYDGIDTAKHLAGSDPIVTDHLGDISHGTKHIDNDHQVLNFGNQLHIAKQAVEPIAEISTSFNLVDGTDAHSNGFAESEIAKYLQLKFPKLQVKYGPHLSLNVGNHGFKKELFHKGPNPGNSPRTKGNGARNFLRDRMAMDAAIGNKPADVYLCGHFHEYVTVTHEMEYNGEWVESRLMVIPPMCSLGHWGRDAMRSLPYVKIGTVCFEVINGQIGQKVVTTKTLDLRKHERIEL